ncbi:LysM peptidoglycan-binding domain-containing protein [Lysinibacter sp. HNR]|uniref:LysM peptidoglycan-binding domain-containing protein n=1 Tax=Lysinibacter sp. HNR TaxID=3031408 RepID=UPI0024348D94|nr:LysM peptidoglycan-binding domain-containing protein [Lysinibacter sp. HNR]WGD38288.1 LysM peptidoglycan-binding domain-containing protein [Lysinibacter sp. HNR]
MSSLTNSSQGPLYANSPQVGSSGVQSPKSSLAQHHASVKTRLRLTRRGRFVITAFIALLLLVIGLWGFFFASSTANAVSDHSDTAFDYVTIQSGETLWGLAESLDPSSDPRDVIHEIMSLNRLGSAQLEPGQQLAIPAAYTLNY